MTQPPWIESESTSRGVYFFALAGDDSNVKFGVGLLVIGEPKYFKT
jgi:hypothetical protein